MYQYTCNANYGVFSNYKHVTTDFRLEYCKHGSAGVNYNRDNKCYELISYTTHVMSYYPESKKLVWFGVTTATTCKHMNAFIKEYCVHCTPTIGKLMKASAHNPFVWDCANKTLEIVEE